MSLYVSLSQQNFSQFSKILSFNLNLNLHIQLNQTTSLKNADKAGLQALHFFGRFRPLRRSKKNVPQKGGSEWLLYICCHFSLRPCMGYTESDVYTYIIQMYICKCIFFLKQIYAHIRIWVFESRFNHVFFIVRPRY